MKINDATNILIIVYRCGKLMEITADMQNIKSQLKHNLLCNNIFTTLAKRDNLLEWLTATCHVKMKKHILI